MNLAIAAPPYFKTIEKLFDRGLAWFDSAPLWQIGLLSILVGLPVATFIRRRIAEHANNPVYIRIGWWTLRQREFFSHIFITGKTGSGKTEGGINRLMFQLFQNVAKWGGCVLDQKGLAHEDLSRFAAHAKRSDDLVILTTRSNTSPPDWKPPHTWNPLLDTRFPDSSIAETLVRTATGCRKAESKEMFWEPTAIEHISKMITALRLSKGVFRVAIDEVLNTLTDSSNNRIKSLVATLKKNDDAESDRIAEHFERRFVGLDARLLSNIRGTISAYLSPFCESELLEVFCANESSFSVSDVDAGKIVCLSISPKFMTSRIYYSALLKNYLCEHANLRFALSKSDLDKSTPLILWMDEAQMLVSGDSLKGDHKYTSLLRQARLAFVIATQDPVGSLAETLGRDIAEALRLNLSMHIHFQAASLAGSEWTADLIGKREIKDVNTSQGPQGVTRSRSKLTTSRYWIEPTTIRDMPKFRAVMRHPDGRKTKRPLLLKPVGPDGKAPSWWRG